MKISEENKNAILKIIQEYVGTDEVNMESDMAGDLGLSSFDAVMIFDTVQEQLGIEVTPDQLYGCRTVGDLMESIEK